MSRAWGRLYAGTRNHRKIKILREKFPDHWTSWYVLIELAIECDDEGWIYVAPGVPFTMKQLAREIGFHRIDTTERFINQLITLSLLLHNDERGLLLQGFSERNFISDSSTPRVKKYREKRAEETNKGDKVKRFRNVSVTPQNRTEQNIVKDIPPTPLRGNGIDEDFETWWKAYPGRRKQGKPVCFAKWKYLSKSGSLPPLPDMIRTLEAQKQSLDWIKDAGEFIPGPLPYLNQSKFLDESIQPLRAAPPTTRNPNCPRCHGKGLYPSGTMPDGSPSMKNCTCEKENV